MILKVNYVLKKLTSRQKGLLDLLDNDKCTVKTFLDCALALCDKEGDRQLLTGFVKLIFSESSRVEVKRLIGVTKVTIVIPNEHFVSAASYESFLNLFRNGGGVEHCSVSFKDTTGATVTETTEKVARTALVKPIAEVESGDMLVNHMFDHDLRVVSVEKKNYGLKLKVFLMSSPDESQKTLFIFESTYDSWMCIVGDWDNYEKYGVCTGDYIPFKTMTVKLIPHLGMISPTFNNSSEGEVYKPKAVAATWFSEKEHKFAYYDPFTRKVWSLRRETEKETLVNKEGIISTVPKSEYQVLDHASRRMIRVHPEMDFGRLVKLDLNKLMSLTDKTWVGLTIFTKQGMIDQEEVIHKALLKPLK